MWHPRVDNYCIYLSNIMHCRWMYRRLLIFPQKLCFPASPFPTSSWINRLLFRTNPSPWFYFFAETAQMQSPTRQAMSPMIDTKSPYRRLIFQPFHPPPPLLSKRISNQKCERNYAMDGPDSINPSRHHHHHGSPHNSRAVLHPNLWAECWDRSGVCPNFCRPFGSFSVGIIRVRPIVVAENGYISSFIKFKSSMPGR